MIPSEKNSLTYLPALNYWRSLFIEFFCIVVYIPLCAFYCQNNQSFPVFYNKVIISCEYFLLVSPGTPMQNVFV